MKIKSLYAQKKPVISFEVFPPKKDYPLEKIKDVLFRFKALKPDFISVTYGALGSTQENTLEIAEYIQNTLGIEALAHLTCIHAGPEEITSLLNGFKAKNIDNILAMRGDIPEHHQIDKTRFRYAKDLTAFIKTTQPDVFSIGGACYPEGHIECKDRVKDILYLKEKVRSGVDFLISQLFFDNNLYYDFLEKLALAGIQVPVSAGIMPVVNFAQMTRIASLTGCSLPAKFKRILDKYEHNPEALREAGMVYATEQVIDLLSWGVDGIHLYTMNQFEVASRIMNSIGEIRSYLLSENEN